MTGLWNTALLFLTVLAHFSTAREGEGGADADAEVKVKVAAGDAAVLKCSASNLTDGSVSGN